MKCAKSDKPCKQCEQNPECQIYSRHYVVEKELKKLLKELEDVRVIVKRILGGV